MERKPNAVREKLKNGQVVTGGVIYSFSPNVVEAAGYAGLDFIRIDCEHAWRQDDVLENLMRASELSGITPIVRIDRDNPYLVKKVMEIGAGGVIMPDCKNAREAVEFVKAGKFPPHGTRGYSSICRSAAWSTAGGEPWVEWCENEPLVGVMIENVDAVENVDEIAAVDGVDFMLFGPADLSMSMGLRKPVPSHPNVQAALDKTIAAARRNGKWIMLGVGFDPQAIEKYAERGISMLEMGSDVKAIQKIWGENVKKLSKINATVNS